MGSWACPQSKKGKRRAAEDKVVTPSSAARMHWGPLGGEGPISIAAAAPGMKAGPPQPAHLPAAQRRRPSPRWRARRAFRLRNAAGCVPVSAPPVSPARRPAAYAEGRPSCRSTCTASAPCWCSALAAGPASAVAFPPAAKPGRSRPPATYRANSRSISGSSSLSEQWRQQLVAGL